MKTKKILQAVLLLVVVGLAVTRVSDDEPSAVPPTSTPPTVPVSATPPTASVDWDARTVDVSEVVGYDIAFCEGEAPYLCVSRGGQTIGAIELASYPGGAGALDEGVDAWLAELVAVMEDDRREGCDPAYEIAGDEVEQAPFAGADGHRYGFTGRVDGQVVERVVGHLTAVDGDLHLLVLNALADDGCLDREGELPLDAVDDLTPALAALAAGSTNLPDIDTPAPGGELRTGWLRGRNAETIDLDAAALLSGEEAVAAAREDGQLPPEGDLPNDVYVDDDEASVTSLAVSDELTVALYDCTADCELREVDADAFLRHEIEPFGGPNAFLSVEVRDGLVVTVQEVYLP